MSTPQSKLNHEPPFNEFARHHVETNRWFRSTEIAYLAARSLAKHLNPTDLAQTVIPTKDRWKFTFQQYYGASVEGLRQKGTIGDLLVDLRHDRYHLAETAIVKEVGALERFLRGWSIDAINAALKPGTTSLNLQYKQKLEATRETLIRNPYQSVSLSRIGELFPTLRSVLTGSTHLRALRPLLSPGIGDLSCQSVAGMWREVRNLILHHDRIVHARFRSTYGQLWANLHSDARDRGSTVRARSVRVGKLLAIDARHVVFCFTSCYQTAVVLHIATGGEQPHTE